MFTEHKAGGEVKIEKLSQAIRVGSTMIKENRGRYLSGGEGCALGMAAVATGFQGDQETLGGIFLNRLTHHLEVHFPGAAAEVRAISDLHNRGLVSALDIASRLEARGL